MESERPEHLQIKKRNLRTLKTYLEFLTEDDFVRLDYTPYNKNITVSAWIEEDENHFNPEADEYAKVARIDWITVPKKLRGTGIAGDEVRRIIDWAGDNDCDYLVIESERRANDFWEHMGFELDYQGSDPTTGYYKLK